MRGRRLAGLLLAEALMLGMGGATLTAQAADTTGDEVSTLSSSSYSTDDLDGITIRYDGQAVDFDPDWLSDSYASGTGHAVVLPTDSIDYDLITVDDLPDGWEYDYMAWAVSEKGYNERLVFTAPDGSKYYATLTAGGADATYSTTDLTDVIITYDGEAVDWDPDDDEIVIVADDGTGDTSLISVEDLPDGWYWGIDYTNYADEAGNSGGNSYISFWRSSDGSGYASSDDPYYSYLIHFDSADPGDSATDSTYTTADLKDVTVTVDGETVDFDPDTHEYEVSDPASVVFDDLPDGWTAESAANDDGSVTWTLTAPDGSTFDYTFAVPSDASADDGTESTDPDVESDSEADMTTGTGSDEESSTDGATSALAQTGVTGGLGVVAMILLLTGVGVTLMREHDRETRLR